MNKAKELIDKVVNGADPNHVLSEQGPDDLYIQDLATLDREQVEEIEDNWRATFKEEPPSHLVGFDLEGGGRGSVSEDLQDFYNLMLEKGRTVGKVSGGGCIYTAVIYKGVEILYSAEMGFYATAFDVKDSRKIKRFYAESLRY